MVYLKKFTYREKKEHLSHQNQQMGSLTTIRHNL